MTPVRAPAASAARLAARSAARLVCAPPRAPPRLPRRAMRRPAGPHGGSDGSGDEESPSPHGHGGSHGGGGVVKRDVNHALRQRTPSPDVGDDTLGWRRAPDAAASEELLRSRGFAAAAHASADVQRELARRVHPPPPHPQWPAVASDDKAPAAADMGVVLGGADFWVEARVRAQWLLGLLALQSLSSFVLEANQGLIRDHLVITLFLTMLVGAGGNSGAQSAVLVIRGLATGQFAATRESYRRVIAQQARVGLLLGTALAAGGYARVYLSEGVPLDAAAIASALFFIVNASVLTGASLPFLLAWRGVDPAHAGTTVQVVMDIAGVVITCAVCRALLAGGAPDAGDPLAAAAAAKHAVQAAAGAVAAGAG